ncbi:MAG TPA: transketolase [Candidatus Binatia bacterium]|nr:transketolase [Candidatus Binatia bacterium]
MLTADRLRKVILDQAYRAQEGHIGSALSIAEIVTVLYREILRGETGDPRRDRLVLSKGHAALAVYGALHLMGRITVAELSRYCSDGSTMGVHAQHGVPGVEFTTGSLGQGLTFGCGCALAARLRDESWRTYVICSDAECDEGSTWEAAMLAAQHRLGNLWAVIDYNRQQAMGGTDGIISLGDLRARWQAFGWEAVEVDGHSEDELRHALSAAPAHPDLPHVVVANTVFGKGVDFMTGQLRWHYATMTTEEHALAISQLRKRQ